MMPDMTRFIRSHVAHRTILVLLILGFGALSIGCQADSGRPYRVTYESGGRWLTVDVLDDNLVHFALATKPPAGASAPIDTTPMVAKNDYRGPRSVRDDHRGTIETAQVRVVIDPATLAATVYDKSRGSVALTTISPVELAADRTMLNIAPGPMQHVYGLGEEFITPGRPNGDWVGRVRTPGNEFGNALQEIDGRQGNVGNAQFPVMYAVGAAGENYALFLDHLYAQTWYFTADPWRVETSNDLLRWYVMTGRDLPALRQRYMELVGRPPVPPKKMFGLWVSEFGFDNWAELEDKLATLEANKFPVDGFVLDLQWFDPIKGNSIDSRMGSLDWNTKRFPEPAKKMAELWAQHGVGIMPIEEPYACGGLPDFPQMAERGYLARQKTSDGPPALLPSWWGTGALVDWTNPAAGDYWHDSRRQLRINEGVMAHWTDLGEPEAFDANEWFYGDPARNLHGQRDVHNIYNFMWAASIARGYARNHVERRPFIMSRSGTCGIQRFGTAMWSGDIGSRLGQLAAHFNAQMHMSFSGVDYFGADVGGFHRGGLDGDFNELYTQWFAYATAGDVPVRPHTANTENKYETAPDRAGDLASNLANLRQRYELIPYLYSLAHRAWLFGEPMVPPPAFYYQNDASVQGLGAEKMIGRDLLVAAVAEYGKKTVDVYLPAGTWFNYQTNERIDSPGTWVRKVPLYRDGKYALPMFARAGAIVPLMYVDEQTMNALGKRRDETRRGELIVRAFADSEPAGAVPKGFMLYEDDGQTIAYQHGEVQTTVIEQAADPSGVARVTVQPARGFYAGAFERRNNVVQFVSGRGVVVDKVLLNETPLERYPTRAAFDAAERGWFDAGDGVTLAKSGVMDVSEGKLFQLVLPKP